MQIERSIKFKITYINPPQHANLIFYINSAVFATHLLHNIDSDKISSFCDEIKAQFIENHMENEYFFFFFLFFF